MTLGAQLALTGCIFFWLAVVGAAVEIAVTFGSPAQRIAEMAGMATLLVGTAFVVAGALVAVWSA